MLAFYTILSLPFYLAIVGTIILSIFIYLKSLFYPRDVLPKLYYTESVLATHVLKKCRLATRAFTPLVWIQNCHVQTFLPWIFPCRSCQFDREYLQLRDRGVVALDWITNLKLHKRKKRTIMIIIPGLTGSAVGVSGLCQLAVKKGFQPLVFNRRGHGNTVLTTPKLQCFGDPSDLRQVVKYINGKYPKASITLVSYGSGCDILLSYLGEFGSSANVCAGVCISSCFDMTHSSASSLTGVYDLYLLIYLKLIIWKHAKALHKVIDVPRALRTWNIREFDRHVFCSMYDYDIEEFYERNNPLRDVDDISVPLLFISSLDDPVYRKINIPYDLVRYYPHFFMLTLDKGGHCGFKEHVTSASWADKLTLDYIESILEFTTKGNQIDYSKNPERSTI